ncbi:hypothetical protein H4S06_004294, partial [Coemansia sp. BCRC 34490]
MVALQNYSRSMASCSRPHCNHHNHHHNQPCHSCSEHSIPTPASSLYHHHRLPANAATTANPKDEEDMSAKNVALQTESCIRRDFGYPAKYHAGSFPWLLSAEHQRTPMDDLDGTTDIGTNAPCLASAAMRFLPL